ncbi:MAG: hypothetical protein NVS3B18_01110 [Candidatus Dormibacteria bacterium]
MSTTYRAVRSVPAAGTGTPCADGGCSLPATFACAYVDRSPRPCGLPGCDEHGRTVAGERFCLRHAGVMEALVVDPLNMLRKPDVDNRAPSLVGWVARALGPLLEEMLGELVTGRERVIAEPLRPIIAADGIGQAWRRSWQLTAGQQPRLVVGIEVEEADDETVLVTVHTEVVHRDKPPWITARRLGERVAREEDERRRAAFYQSLLEAVATGASKQLRRRDLRVPKVAPTA